MLFTIRPAVYSDIPYLYTICLQTGASGSDATNLFTDPWLIGHYFVAPYFFHDISLCYIAEIDNIPQGYLVATQNTLLFREWLSLHWLPQLRERYPINNPTTEPISESQQNIITMIHTDHNQYSSTDLEIFTNYPAHLHIDLLPILQGKGCGKKMMQILFEELKKRNCSGLHLGVDKTNVSAQFFYTKIGFTSIEETSWGQYYGITL